MKLYPYLKKFRSIVYTTYLKKRYSMDIGVNSFFLGKADVDDRGKIYIGNDTVIFPWVVLKNWGGYIRLGSHCTVNSFCHISGNGGVEIGDNVRIATQCVIVSANHKYEDSSVPIYLQGETKEKIIIEDDCWLGAGVKVLAGVHIGKGCVIGAGAVVTHDIEPYSVAVGVPAKVIKIRAH